MELRMSLLNEYVDIIRQVYGEHVKKVILYGSYARGDQTEDSDIDIMILLDVPEHEAKPYQRKLFDATFDFNMEKEIDINPVIHNEMIFDKWVDSYPFFGNINREGVLLYGAA